MCAMGSAVSACLVIAAVGLPGLRMGEGASGAFVAASPPVGYCPEVSLSTWSTPNRAWMVLRISFPPVLVAVPVAGAGRFPPG